MTEIKRRVLYLAGLIALLAFGACGKKEAPKEESHKSAADKAPKIVAVNDTFDFGKIKQGKKAEHIFKLRNDGTADLKIERAKGS